MVDRVIDRVDANRIDTEFLKVLDVARAVVAVSNWILFGTITA